MTEKRNNIRHIAFTDSEVKKMKKHAKYFSTTTSALIREAIMRYFITIENPTIRLFSIETMEKKELWRIDILKKYNFTCVVCGKPCNSVHHIYSRRYCQENNPDLEWDLRNGVPACYECHDEISKDGRKWFK